MITRLYAVGFGLVGLLIGAALETTKKGQEVDEKLKKNLKEFNEDVLPTVGRVMEMRQSTKLVSC